MGLELLAKNADDLAELAGVLEKYVVARLDLAGGWLPSIERDYAAKVVGYYRFDEGQSKTIREMAEGLGALYKSIGTQFGQYWPNRNGSWPFDRFSTPQEILLDRFVQGNQLWATTLRADFVLVNGCEPKIVEVNSDNVAGLEDLVIFLGFYSQRDEVPQAHRDEMITWLARIQENLGSMLGREYLAFCGRLSDSKRSDRPAAIHDARIAVVYEDKYDSFFLARFTAAILSGLGYNVVCCRPEHLHRRGSRLMIESPTQSTKLSPIDIVIRHWLFFEMFEGDVLARMEPLLAATEANDVLTLNPFSERLLFSKAILAELTTPTFLQLSKEERSFINRFITPTTLLPTSSVLKPSSEFGGRKVTMLDETTVWVSQPRLDCEKLPSALYRTIDRSGGKEIIEIGRKDLYIVHGLLVHGGSINSPSGIMTRVGPDPVVNFSRGAQIVPGFLSR